MSDITVTDIKVLSSANPTEASSSAQQSITATTADGLIALPSGAMTGKRLTRQILSPK